MQTNAPILHFWGLVFGIVVLVWKAGSIREAINVRNASFLVAAELIWLLVFYLLNPFLIMLYGTVALSTVLLAGAQAWLLGASKRRLLVAIPSIFGIWLLLTYIAVHFVPWDVLVNFLGMGGAKVQAPSFLGLGQITTALFGVTMQTPQLTLALFGVSQTIWQAAYLLCMFGLRPSGYSTLSGAASRVENTGGI